jgi:hypothetical protein
VQIYQGVGHLGTIVGVVSGFGFVAPTRQAMLSYLERVSDRCARS